MTIDTNVIRASFSGCNDERTHNVACYTRHQVCCIHRLCDEVDRLRAEASELKQKLAAVRVVIRVVDKLKERLEITNFVE